MDTRHSDLKRLIHGKTIFEADENDSNEKEDLSKSYSIYPEKKSVEPPISGKNY